jgi:DNA-binding transcriptional LysR family regulator
MPMRLSNLQALRAVFETGSATDAARRLHRTQPQVSRLIAALETELGFKLFVRHRGGLTPTREGRLFYDEARGILSGIDEIRTIADNIRTRSDGWIQIVVQRHFAHAVLPEALARFSAHHPQAHCSLELHSWPNIGPWIAGHRYDIGIAALPLDVPEVHAIPFASVDVLAALPAGHALARKAHLEPGDFVGQPFIALPTCTLLRRAVDQLFAELSLRLAIRTEISSTQALCQMVAQGLGIALTDPLATHSLSRDAIVLRPWRPGLRLTYGFLYSSTHPPSALALELADTVAETTEALNPEHVHLIGGWRCGR